MDVVGGDPALPRRDMTTRKDYDAVLAVNRHVITPSGWVQEEDNSKLVMRVGLTCWRAKLASTRTADRRHPWDGDAYWNATKAFWSGARGLGAAGEGFAAFRLTVQGEPEQVDVPILDLADDVQAGTKTTVAALVEAKRVIAKFTTTDVGPLERRLDAGSQGRAAPLLSQA